MGGEHHMFLREGFDCADGNSKPKGRHRKKLLYKTVCEQMEFYFSDANLSKDRFLCQLVENDPCELLTLSQSSGYCCLYVC